MNSQKTHRCIKWKPQREREGNGVSMITKIKCSGRQEAAELWKGGCEDREHSRVRYF